MNFLWSDILLQRHGFLTFRWCFWPKRHPADLCLLLRFGLSRMVNFSPKTTRHVLLFYEHHNFYEDRTKPRLFAWKTIAYTSVHGLKMTSTKLPFLRRLNNCCWTFFWPRELFIKRNFLLHFLWGCNKQIIWAVAALFDTYTRNLYFSKRQRLTLQLIFLSPFFVPVILTHYLKSPIFAWKLDSFIFVKLNQPWSVEI